MCPYIPFTIYDPKERKIAAPTFRDHVVGHAIHRVLTPLVEKMLISDTYASRVGKGPHHAVLNQNVTPIRFTFTFSLSRSDDRAPLVAVLHSEGNFFIDQNLLPQGQVAITITALDYPRYRRVIRVK